MICAVTYRAALARLLILAALALPTVVTAASMYSWVDANGVKHYSDQPPPAKAKDAKKLNLTGRGEAPADPAPAETPEASAGKAMARAAGYEDQDIKRNCEIANQNVITLTAAPPHPPGSEDAIKREQSIEKAKAQVQLFCH